MNIDESTGLPELPRGYFWRVAESYRGSDYLRVQIVEKGKFWGNKVVSWGALKKSEATHSEILSTAQYVLFRAGRSPGLVGFEWKKFVGDYPPKKL